MTSIAESFVHRLPPSGVGKNTNKTHNKQETLSVAYIYKLGVFFWT